MFKFSRSFQGLDAFSRTFQDPCEPRGGGGAGYSHIWAIKVRATEYGMVFEVLDP